MTYTFDLDSFSDLHKDAYGFRPSAGFFQTLNEASDVEKQAIWDDLIVALDRSIEEDREMEQEAISSLEMRVSVLLACGAVSRKHAFQWILDSLDVNGDLEFADWELGVPYGTFKRELS